MGISKLFYRAPVYKFSRFDLPINFDYPADLLLITKVISTFKMQFILSEMLAMGFFRDSGQPPALNILELLAGSPLALLHQANTQGSYGTRGCRRKPCSLKPPHRLVAAKNQWPALPAAPAVYPITPWNEPGGESKAESIPSSACRAVVHRLARYCLLTGQEVLVLHQNIHYMMWNSQGLAYLLPHTSGNGLFIWMCSLPELINIFNIKYYLLQIFGNQPKAKHIRFLLLVRRYFRAPSLFLTLTFFPLIQQWKKIRRRQENTGKRKETSNFLNCMFNFSLGGKL